MSKFIITRVENDPHSSREFISKQRVFYYTGDYGPFPKGSSDRNRAVKFDTRDEAELELTSKPNRHPFKLGNIEEIETVSFSRRPDPNNFGKYLD